MKNMSKIPKKSTGRNMRDEGITLRNSEAVLYWVNMQCDNCAEDFIDPTDVDFNVSDCGLGKFAPYLMYITDNK